MEASNGEDERSRRANRITQVDATVAPPAERASRVLKYLQKGDFDTWDITCFCAEYLGMMSSTWTWLHAPAIATARLVYAAHYENDEFKTGETKLNAQDSESEAVLRTAESVGEGVRHQTPATVDTKDHEPYERHGC